MKTNKSLNLFGTPIWIEHLPNHESLNRRLLRDGAGYKHGKNFFDLPGDGVAELRSYVLGRFKEIQAQYQWRIPPRYLTARQNPIYPGEMDSPHWHSNAVLVGVYYVQAGDNQGDILLHDPRGGTWWPEPNAVTESNKYTRTFHRVKPESGMLVMFPGYLIHSVEANLSDSMRLSIPIEFLVSSDDPRYASTELQKIS
jgi:hypothetical protein